MLNKGLKDSNLHITKHATGLHERLEGSPAKNTTVFNHYQTSEVSIAFKINPYLTTGGIFTPRSIFSRMRQNHLEF
jgi:hypothetical protein